MISIKHGTKVVSGKYTHLRKIQQMVMSLSNLPALFLSVLSYITLTFKIN